MSTRWYPLYQKGNPQLRVFLPNFWMKLVEPKKSQPPNIVQFQCSMEMTKYDVKNYLEKIYNVKTVDVRTRIHMGKTKKNYPQPYIVKEDDVKIAYAILPKNESFQYPDIFTNEAKAKDDKYEQAALKDMETGYKKYLKTNNKPGVPGWFSI